MTFEPIPEFLRRKKGEPMRRGRSTPAILVGREKPVETKAGARLRKAAAREKAAIEAEVTRIVALAEHGRKHR